MDTGTDQTQALAEQVQAAAAAGHRLAISGGGTRRAQAFPEGLPADVAPLEVGGHHGIVTLAPSELVVTVRAGTPVRTLQAALDEVGMMLPFEPSLATPAGTVGGTVGGMVALGLSGPRRPWTASLRDAVLGTRIINGRGEVLRFGGEVMKNVAGFDVSRLMAGSLGGLGVLLEVSFKLLPQPPCQAFLRREQPAEAFLQQARDWGLTALPFSGLAWADGTSRIRLGGGEKAVQEAIQRLGAEVDPDGAAFWQRLRDHQDERFTRRLDRGERLWRLSLPPATPGLNLHGDTLINWGGGERWLRSKLDPQVLRAIASRSGGHARIWDGPVDGTPWLHPRPAPLARLEQRVRAALDPDHVFYSPLLGRGRDATAAASA